MPHNAQPPREPTHLLVYAAQANAALLRCCPVVDAMLGTFADGFIAVIVGEVVGWWTSSRQESTPHQPRNFSFSVLKLTDHYKTRGLLSLIDPVWASNYICTRWKTTKISFVFL